MWDGHISVVNTAGIWKGPTLPSRDKMLATHAAHSFVALRCRKVRKKQIRRMYLTYPGMWTPYPLCFVSILQAQWALEANTTARFLKWQELPVGRAVLGPCCSGDGALEHEWSPELCLGSHLWVWLCMFTGSQRYLEPGDTQFLSLGPSSSSRKRTGNWETMTVFPQQERLIPTATEGWLCTEYVDTKQNSMTSLFHTNKLPMLLKPTIHALVSSPTETHWVQEIIT